MLSCQLYQRSADIALGVPFNIASYALLTHMIANHCNLKVGHFIHTIGDAHIYENHIEGVKLQLRRTPKNLPQLQMPMIESFNTDYIRTLKVSDFRLINYDPMESIKFDMAV
jgi:thymidylate synthase